MSTPLRTIECTLPRQRGGGGRRPPGDDRPAEPRLPLAPGRVPRVSRLMALALRFEGLLQQGLIADYATLARLGHVSRARVSQITSLLGLAPDIQEALLFLPCTQRGRDPINLGQLMPLAAVLDWRQQRRLWQELRSKELQRLPSEPD